MYHFPLFIYFLVCQRYQSGPLFNLFRIIYNTNFKISIKIIQKIILNIFTQFEHWLYRGQHLQFIHSHSHTLVGFPWTFVKLFCLSCFVRTKLFISLFTPFKDHFILFHFSRPKEKDIVIYYYYQSYTKQHKIKPLPLLEISFFFLTKDKDTSFIQMCWTKICIIFD